MPMSENKVKPGKPPVFILNMSYSGLGIARNLHGKGLRVVGLTADSKMPGVHTRLCEAIYKIPDSRDEPEALCTHLLELARHESHPIVIFPTRDFDVFFLENFRTQLEPAYIIPQPGLEIIERVMDKYALFQIAQQAGIDTPWTFHCRTVEELEAILPQVPFPIVVKPRYAWQWRRKGAWEKVGARKAFVVHTAQQLQDEYCQLSTVQSEVILQEFIPGHDSDIVVCCCYVSRKKEMAGYFTARKLVQSPALFGTGCLVETDDISELVATTEKLLSVCNYTGIAEVEYKVNKRSHKYYLIEVNPRHWDQHELGTKVGINLSWIAYNDIALGSRIYSKPSYNGRITWVAEKEFLFETLHRFSRRKQPPNVFQLFLKKKYLFGTFRIADPQPGFYLLKNFLIETVVILWHRFKKNFCRRHN